MGHEAPGENYADWRAPKKNGQFLSVVANEPNQPSNKPPESGLSNWYIENMRRLIAENPRFEAEEKAKRSQIEQTILKADTTTLIDFIKKIPDPQTLYTVLELLAEHKLLNNREVVLAAVTKWPHLALWGTYEEKQGEGELTRTTHLVSDEFFSNPENVNAILENQPAADLMLRQRAIERLEQNIAKDIQTHNEITQTLNYIKQSPNDESTITALFNVLRRQGFMKEIDIALAAIQKSPHKALLGICYDDDYGSEPYLSSEQIDDIIRDDRFISILVEDESIIKIIEERIERDLKDQEQKAKDATTEAARETMAAIPSRKKPEDSPAMDLAA